VYGIENVWYVLIAIACVIAVTDARKAVFLGILIDALRDPVRKLIPGKPVAVTLAGAGFWVVLVVVLAASRRKDLKSLFRTYPGLRSAFILLMLALFPAAGVAVISYTRGWMLAGIGATSYVIPAIGVLCGYSLLREEREIIRLMRWYIIVNTIMLMSVPMEYFVFDVPALGGIDFEWIRYREGYTVDLMCGWYRSPDIMGLHAAHVMMFGLLLASRPQQNLSPGWLLPVLWAGFCVLLSGRRKMIGIPLVFIAALLTCGMIFRITRINRLAGIAMTVGLMGGALIVFFWAPDEAYEYTEFVTSLATEGAVRFNELVIGSTLGTLQQAGVIGGGLGAATQGRYYAAVLTSHSMRGWQEDGVSRMLFEFGVPGFILMLISLGLVLLSIRKAIRMMPQKGAMMIMQLGMLAVVIGNAASYTISHQQFSGDPVSGLIVTLLIGMILRLPLIQHGTSRPSVQTHRNFLAEANPILPVSASR
jgi:hypothetical protein